MLDPSRMISPQSSVSTSDLVPQSKPPANAQEALTRGDKTTAKEAFTDFVGQTLFGSMLTSMRKTVGTPAYMHGGRTEEVFQKQMDQLMVEDLTDASADSIAEPMFELFNLQRR
ncbi:MAG: hypothetical protein AB8B91_17005 [Rubripirellula sp.]